MNILLTKFAVNAKDFGLPEVEATENTLSSAIGAFFLIIGMLSVLFIIIGAIQYATSAGDAGQVSKAKNTILYSIIGMIISMAAYAIITFVIGRF